MRADNRITDPHVELKLLPNSEAQYAGVNGFGLVGDKPMLELSDAPIYTLPYGGDETAAIPFKAHTRSSVVLIKDRVSMKNMPLWLTALLVVWFHLLLLMALDSVWEPADLDINMSKPPELKAYLYHEVRNVEVESSSQKVLAADGVVNAVINNDPINETIKKQQVAVSVAENDIDDVDVQQEQRVIARMFEESQLNEKQVTDEEIDNEKVQQALWLQTATDKKSNYFSAQPPIEPISNLSNFSTSTQDYFSRERDAALDTLTINTANRFTGTASASEMDGDMMVLELHKEDAILNAKTLDNEMDPNRIVKEGNTCYRIVKTPTAINPHAENLGFPFSCGEDEVVAALKRAISKRVYKKIN